VTQKIWVKISLSFLKRGIFLFIKQQFSKFFSAFSFVQSFFQKRRKKKGLTKFLIFLPVAVKLTMFFLISHSFQKSLQLSVNNPRSLVNSPQVLRGVRFWRLGRKKGQNLKMLRWERRRSLPFK